MSTDLDLSDFYETNLLEVLTRSFINSCPPVDIPPYQRPYRWLISDVRKLLDDLDSFRYNPETGKYDEGAKYYYGTICFQVYYDRETQQVCKLELIDGQQRLTSFLILIKALLDATQNIKDEEIKSERDGLIKLLRNEPELDLDATDDDKEWNGDDWQPQYEYRQPQTKEHISAIYCAQLTEYLRVINLIKEATDTEDGTFVTEFFKKEFKRMTYVLENGVFAVRILKNRYDAELFFQCENNRGMEMELIDMLKAYHLRIALAGRKDEKDVGEKIKEIWKELTKTEDRNWHLKETVLSLLLIRWGVAYWMHWDKSNFERLKGIHGTDRGKLVVDEKLVQVGVGSKVAEGKFLPDLMSPLSPGLTFFQTLEYYQRIVEALAEPGSLYSNMVGYNRYFVDSHKLAVQAAVCWLDRFATVYPNPAKPFDADVGLLCSAYNEDSDFIVYVQYFLRLFKRLKEPMKLDETGKQIQVFGQLQGARQIAFFKLNQPTENLITLPYRTNSPAECRRELERLTHPDQMSWAMLGDRRDIYREYVENEVRVELTKYTESAK